MLITLVLVLILIAIFSGNKKANNKAADDEVILSYISAGLEGTISRFVVEEADHIAIGETLFVVKLPDGKEEDITSTIDGTVLEIYLYEGTRIKENTIVMRIIRSPEVKGHG